MCMNNTAQHLFINVFIDFFKCAKCCENCLFVYVCAHDMMTYISAQVCYAMLMQQTCIFIVQTGHHLVGLLVVVTCSFPALPAKPLISLQ